MTTLERAISRLDGEKKETSSRLMSATDPALALRLHNEVASLATQLTTAEERWCGLQAEVDET